MTGTRPAAILRHLDDADAPADGELLGRFVQARDPVAFEALVRRHGPMVLAVCRKVAGHSHDAEDAFQAAFLVLAQKAGAIHTPGLLGNWLYGVAVRVAQKARRTAARRRGREVPIVDVPEPAAAASGPGEVGPVVHEELARLPDHYRDPILLCDLRGLSRTEAATALGIPEGTLSSRLNGGRKKLADRLARRGLALAAAVVPAALAEARGCSVPDSLVSNTCGVAANWAAGAAVPAPLLRLASGGFPVRTTLLLGLLAVTLTGAGAAIAARNHEADPDAPRTPAVATPVAAVAPVVDETSSAYAAQPKLRQAIDLPVSGALSVIWEPTGNRIAIWGTQPSNFVNGLDRMVYIADVDGSRVTRRVVLPVQKQGSFVGFTRGGQYAITDVREEGLVSGMHRLEYWSLTDNKVPPGPMGGAPGDPAGAEGGGTDLVLFAPTRTVALDSDPTVGYAFAADGKTFRTVYRELGERKVRKIQVREVNADTGATLKTLLQLDGTFETFQLSPDGKRLFVVAADASISATDVDTGKRLWERQTELTDPEFAERIVGPGTLLGVSPDGSLVLATRYYRKSLLLAAATGEPQPQMELPEYPTLHASAGSFTGNGRLLAAGVGQLVKQEPRRPLGGGPGGIAPKDRAQRPISLEQGPSALTVWDTATGKAIKSWGGNSIAVAFHPTKPLLAVIEPNGDKQTRLGLWDFTVEAARKK